MLSSYVAKKMSCARYKILEDDTYFGEIPAVRGVWAHAQNLEDCRAELREVLEGWLYLKIHAREHIAGFSPIRRHSVATVV